MKIKLALIHVIFPLFTGGLLYICFRDTSLRMFNWFEIIEVDSFAFGIRNLLIIYKKYLPDWTYYSLPDGLWVYSFTSAILILWNGKLNHWLIIPFLTGIVVEIEQGLKIFPGTFDMLDLVLTCTALFSSITIFNHQFKQYEKTFF